MIIKKAHFIKNAIANGYDNNRCNGWDWIKENLSELDYIFQSKEYKEQNGMKYLCMPFLLESDELLELEKQVLRTAWYLNNEREQENTKENYKQKMLTDGWLELKPDIEYRGKIALNAEYHGDWATNNINETATIKTDGSGKPFIVAKGKRSRGWYPHSLENAFYKKI